MNEFFALYATTLLIALSGFQVLLAMGKPLGRFAWGGQYDVLPVKYRIGSALSVILYVFFILVILQEAGIWTTLSEDFSSSAIWWIHWFLFLEIFLNAASRSMLEKFVMTPLVFQLWFSFLVVAW